MADTQTKSPEIVAVKTSVIEACRARRKFTARSRSPTERWRRRRNTNNKERRRMQSVNDGKSMWT